MALWAPCRGVCQLSHLFQPASLKGTGIATAVFLPGGRIQRLQGEASQWRGAHWVTQLKHPLQRAAAAALEPVELEEQAEPRLDEPRSSAGKQQWAATGAFQRLPHVPAADEHLKSALKRAKKVPGNKGLKNKAQYARNLAARRLDALTKELATPLGKVTRGFPRCSQLHPFEQALLDLTLGIESYEKRLAKLDSLRKSCLEVGKSFAGKAAKAANMKDAYAVLEEGTESLEAVFRKSAAAVDAVKDVAMILRKLPTVDPSIPTLALVGAPNVGKSSLVQLLSSGTPEICNYPFTTRTVKMGHFFVDGAKHQVTDTPGLLNRNEEERNAMERLTLACLEHLPTAVMFVADLTGECGTQPSGQWLIRQELRQRFPDRPWLDVLSKADLLGDVFQEADRRRSEGQEHDSKEDEEIGRDAVGFAANLPAALRISSVEEIGIEDLKAAVVKLIVSKPSAK